MSEVNYDCIVIGAGASGLVAAVELARRGRRPLVLEARDRVGGRILTQRSEFGWPVELGAEFLHGMPPELCDLIEPAGMRLCRVIGKHVTAEHNRLATNESLFDRLDEIFDLMRTAAEKADMSFLQFAANFSAETDIDAAAWQLAKRYVEGFNAALAGDVSIRWLVQEEDALATIGGEQQYRLIDGYDQIINRLFAELNQLRVPVLTGKAVTAVNWQPGRATVEAHDNDSKHHVRYTAPQVLVTVPIGVLQAEHGGIRFIPRLNGKMEAMSKIAAGQVRRLVLIFSEPFWLNRLQQKHLDYSGVSFIHAPDQPLPTWWTQFPIQTPMLVGWAGGSAANALQALSEPELVLLALSSLAKIFSMDNGYIESRLSAAFEHNWAQDPYSRCAYSYVRAGGEDAPAILAEPQSHTLFFAGEATDSDGFSGTVHGALRSGNRAANQMLRCTKEASA